MTGINKYDLSKWALALKEEELIILSEETSKVQLTSTSSSISVRRKCLSYEKVITTLYFLGFSTTLILQLNVSLVKFDNLLSGEEYRLKCEYWTLNASK